MTPKSKEELRKEIAYILDNYEPGEVRVSLPDGSSEIHSAFVLAIDDLLELFISYHQHLYTRQDVKAICEEVVGNYSGGDLVLMDYTRRRRQSIDSIIDKWGK